MVARSAAETKSAEENATQYQQAHSLPIGQRANACDGRQNGIPQPHDHSTQQESDCSYEQGEKEKEVAAMVSLWLVHSSIIYEFLIKIFEAAAQVLHCVAFARNERFDIFASSVGHRLKSLVFQFVPNEDIALVFR